MSVKKTQSRTNPALRCPNGVQPARRWVCFFKSAAIPELGSYRRITCQTGNSADNPPPKRKAHPFVWVRFFKPSLAPNWVRIAESPVGLETPAIILSKAQGASGRLGSFFQALAGPELGSYRRITCRTGNPADNPLQSTRFIPPCGFVFSSPRRPRIGFVSQNHLSDWKPRR